MLFSAGSAIIVVAVDVVVVAADADVDTDYCTKLFFSLLMLMIFLK